MVYVDLQLVLSVLHAIGNVKGPYGAAHQFLGILMTVEDDGGIGSHTVKLQEVAFAILLLHVEGLVVGRLSVQVAMTQLTVAVVVVEVMGNVNRCRHRVAAHGALGCPSVVERDNVTAPFPFRLREAHVTTSQRHAGGYGDASLLVVVDGTVEVIDHPVVLHYIALMGKHLVVGL